MPRRHLAPVSNQPPYYHQKMAWKITEDDWNKDETLFLELGTKIPGSWNGAMNGGSIQLFGRKRFFGFVTYWPNEVKEEDLKIETIVRMKKGSEIRFFLKDSDYYSCGKFQNFHFMLNKKTVLPNPTDLDLYDENKAFFLEAEILILKKSPEMIDSVNAPCQFLKDMKSIMKLEDCSDLKIVCSGKVFKCHKNILSARSTVFKNMLSGETLENLNGEVPIEDSSAEAVEEMLKYIYTGEIPDSDKLDVLSIELLHLAEKYHLDSLKFACGGSIASSLTISTCISDFITVERYFPPDSSVRKKVDQFLRCNAEQVVECEAWDDLVKKFPEVSRDLVRAMVKRGKD
eukprot:GFUD01024907.1.p1 GENE.GFUD01024907.1~~GFUD01024907.1.p1  ORF type:complete len:344 (-),score=84.70 GFUD01024907.1:66-1097(-)